MDKNYVMSIIRKYNDTGRHALYNKKNHSVSINGGKYLPEKIAVIQMLECIKKENEK